MWDRLKTLGQFLAPSRREESSTVAEKVAGIAERRLLAKHEQSIGLLAKLMASSDSEITVADIMTQHHVNSTHYRTSVKAIPEIMHAARTRHLLVHDDDGDLVGIINEKDLLQRRGHTARCVMTRDPIVVPPDCLIERALSRVIRNRISCLPVVNGLEAVGVITRTDLLLAFEDFLKFVREYHLLDSPDLATGKSSASESAVVGGAILLP